MSAPLDNIVTVTEWATVETVTVFASNTTIDTVVSNATAILKDTPASATDLSEQTTINDLAELITSKDTILDETEAISWLTQIMTILSTLPTSAVPNRQLIDDFFAGIKTFIASKSYTDLIRTGTQFAVDSLLTRHGYGRIAKLAANHTIDLAFSYLSNSTTTYVAGSNTIDGGQDLLNMKHFDLQMEAKRRGLSIRGNKADLKERIQADMRGSGEA